jgi:hypothetical protein
LSAPVASEVSAHRRIGDENLDFAGEILLREIGRELLDVRRLIQHWGDDGDAADPD